ncbi:MAG: hypothetical protein CBD63_03850 [Candidatus Pelagibacter sp. TMED203]|nr:MAG: hypothetical protein CBD63_03850 [Candidatus Pelagibacter sp. TMED203]|tara:strand:+ start:3611 stop:4309 length:699 start_codon:yes stop_codon:yes gene_type:complete
MQKESYITAISHNKKHWWWKSRREIFEEILKKYIKKKIDILDYGAGVGSNISMLSSFGKCDAYDVNKNALIYLKKKYRVVKKINKKYDLIFFTDTLEHIKNDKKILLFLKSRLKKNGIIFLTVPAYNFLWTSKDEDLKHFRRYNKGTLLHATQKEFSILKISYFNTLLFPILSLILLFFRFFRIRFINQAETQPLSIINFILYKIFSFEKYFIKSANFPFGLSLLAILRKSK